MFLEMTMRRNPALIDAAVRLHRAGEIPSNAYVIDADAVTRNAGALAAAARDEGLVLYQMTKQFGRNPLLARAIAATGMGAVAVDLDEARVLHASGVPVRHLGHLVQLPRRRIAEALAMEPDEVTVFGLEQARAISAVSARSGRRQALLVRVVGPRDLLFPHQRGGVALADLVEVAGAIDALPGVRLAGVTSFPCLLFDERSLRVEATPNLHTVAEAGARLREAGFDAPVVNAPSVSCVATLPVLRAAGATHAEPGSALIGNTPLHAEDETATEVPAMVYVTEVSHVDGAAAYAIGGGLYPRSRMREALVWTAGGRVRVAAEAEDAASIDYYGTLRSPEARAFRPGDTVVYAFRSQVFVSRSFVAVVGGVGEDPAVLGLFDSRGNQLGEDLLPLGAAAQEVTPVMSLSRRIVITNPDGLHARPAARFAEEARRFEAELSIAHGGRSGSCKSTIALMRLGLCRGTEIELHAEGPDAEAAIGRLAELLEELAGEERAACA